VDHQEKARQRRQQQKQKQKQQQQQQQTKVQTNVKLGTSESIKSFNDNFETRFWLT
jgi:Ethanolamine utilization protein EutJ (predicted chaperonin)